MSATTEWVRGRGLFSGLECAAHFIVSAPGTGVWIGRGPGMPVRASVAALSTQPEGTPARNTTLALGGDDRVMTVEHALSTLAGLGLWDGFVAVEGPELPIGDGSASPFVDAARAAGLQPSSPTPIVIRREVVVERGGARIVARPRKKAGCLYRYELDYGPGAPIPAQEAEWDSSGPGAPAAYARDVAPARTFCLEAEARAMQAAGLFKDFSPRDLLVIGEHGPIDNAYRFDNEPARHKLLDLIGDLALAGRPLQGEIVATRAGHSLNHEMAVALTRLL